MTTLRTSAMRSAGDFDAIWREMAQTEKRVWTLAHEPLPHLYSTWEPHIDFVEHDDAYVLHAELPGMQRDDITVECRDGLLTVYGEQTIASAPHGPVPRIKHGYRAFARRFVLSEPVEADAVAMTYTHGVLEVHLPKVVKVFDQQNPKYMVPKERDEVMTGTLNC